ncbi:hypothetical protein EGW08_020187 [Elysia chlorotica]|uniref:Ras-like protein family member 10B n=1 Tax=Elysia chlorotica TaxID=188477 RepID=A0A433SRY9_ELYCH|nr:hypothetical protein EGW08_020187 [Elysia chlorotica]
MTIPQGDSRGTASVSERRKVTFEGDYPAVGQLHSATTNASTTPSSTSTAASSTTTTCVSTTTKAGQASGASSSSAYALTSSASSDSSSASCPLPGSAAAGTGPGVATGVGPGTAPGSVGGSYATGSHSVNAAYVVTPEQEQGLPSVLQAPCTSSSLSHQSQFNYHPTDGDTHQSQFNYHPTDGETHQSQFNYHPTDGDTSLPRLHTSLHYYTKSQEDDRRLKQQANKLINRVNSGDVGTRGATKSTSSVPFEDLQKSALPLLNLFIPDDSLHSSSFSSSVSSFSDRSRKVSLNLARPSTSELLDSETTERVRRYSQPLKSTYQRVPLDDPSPTHNRFSSDFTLSAPIAGTAGETETAQGTGHVQAVKTHSHNAQVHGTFGNNPNPRAAASRLPAEQTPADGQAAKVVLFRKQQSPAQGAGSNSPSNSSKSLDDLTARRQGLTRSGTRTSSAAPNRPQFLSTSAGDSKLSASSENVSLSFRRRQQTVSGSGGGGARRDHAHQHQHPPPSPGSPSRCCLVSVSRVPMAAAASHLTLDSEYQTVRLAVLGAPGVGKSSIVRQFVLQQFPEEYVPTEQRQIFCPAVIINEHLYEVRIIDCPYIPYFPVNSLYEWTDFRGYGLRNATAYVLVYDITSEDSFEYIKSLRLQILESRSRQDVPIFVVGNKHDLADERGVPRREVANMVKKQWKCGYIECSAKFNWHIMLLFKELMKSIDFIDYGHKPTSMRVQDALRRNRCVIL